MLNILSNILLTGVVLGITISMALIIALLGRVDVSAFLIIFASLVSYLISLHLHTLAKNIEPYLPDEEEPPHD